MCGRRATSEPSGSGSGFQTAKGKGKKEDNEPCVWNGRRLVLAFAFFSSPNLTHDELIHAGPRFSRLSLLRAQIIIRGTDGHPRGSSRGGTVVRWRRRRGWLARQRTRCSRWDRERHSGTDFEGGEPPVDQERFRVFHQCAGGAGIDRFGGLGGQARGVAVRLEVARV